ncbi:hypothetical protein Tco_0098679 [Tanacetum coccineum]
MFRGTPVISAGFQAKISKFCFSKAHSSFRPFSVNVDPMATVCSGYSGWIAIFIFSSSTFFAVGGWMLGPEIIAHSKGITLLLFNVTVPPSTGNFNIPCAVDGTARIFLMPGLPIIALCWDGDLMTMKFIQAEVECVSSPIFTSKAIWPSGQMVSPLNPIRCLVLGFPSISVTLVVVGVGPLSGKGPRIIVFADASVLPRPVFVRGGARVRLSRYSRASLKYPEHGPCQAQ